MKPGQWRVIVLLLIILGLEMLSNPSVKSWVLGNLAIFAPGITSGISTPNTINNPNPSPTSTVPGQKNVPVANPGQYNRFPTPY